MFKMKIVTVAIVSGLLTGIVSFIIGSALWFAPWAMKISHNARDLPIWKNLPVKMFLPAVFIWGLIFTVALAIIFIFVKDSIPGNIYIQGLIFGVVIWFVKNLTEAVNSFVLINKPLNYILLELGNALFGLILSGIMISLLTNRFAK